jgi:hypothetical protein
MTLGLLVSYIENENKHDNGLNRWKEYLVTLEHSICHKRFLNILQGRGIFSGWFVVNAMVLRL